MLNAPLCSVLAGSECEAIVSGLQAVAKEWEEGKFEIREGDEDIHTANERRLKVTRRLARRAPAKVSFSASLTSIY